MPVSIVQDLASLLQPIQCWGEIRPAQKSGDAVFPSAEIFVRNGGEHRHPASIKNNNLRLTFPRNSFGNCQLCNRDCVFRPSAFCRLEKTFPNVPAKWTYTNTAEPVGQAKRKRCLAGPIVSVNR